MSRRIQLVLFTLWLVHSLAVFSYYEYHHLRKWLVTPKAVAWVKEKLR